MIAIHAVAVIMSDSHLFSVELNAAKSVNWRDQMQMALAIADSFLLRSLLTDCKSAIARPQHIASIAAKVSVPIGANQVADGVLHYQAIKCVLAEPLGIAGMAFSRRALETSRELARVMQHESEMQMLGQKLSLSPTVALLAESGFTPGQIQEILHLAQDSWHKSWWLAIDCQGQFSVPFLRCLRALHYPDGSLILQYKDYFEQDKPTCFASQTEQVLIVAKSEPDGFSDTMRQINQQREGLGIDQAVLVSPYFSLLEAEAFIRQGVSIYSLRKWLLPFQANCADCGCYECPMNAMQNSPVTLCHNFLPISEVL